MFMRELKQRMARALLRPDAPVLQDESSANGRCLHAFWRTQFYDFNVHAHETQ